MGKISLSLKGKPFFNWEGEAEAFDNIAQFMRSVVELAGNTATVEEWAVSYAVHLAQRGDFLSDDLNQREGELRTITYFLLSRQTGHPNHPGRFVDYLSLWDFSFDILEVDEATGTLRMYVEATLDGDVQEWPSIH